MVKNKIKNRTKSMLNKRSRLMEILTKLDNAAAANEVEEIVDMRMADMSSVHRHILKYRIKSFGGMKRYVLCV